jgi:hypothetical protein
MMLWHVLRRPVGAFGIGAIFLIMVSLCQFSAFSELGTTMLLWAVGLLILEFFRQVIVYYYGDSAEERNVVAVSKPKSALLCALSFAVPPIGLVSWLALDTKAPTVARRAGRCGVRGVLLFMIVGSVAFLNSQVNIALQAIEYAHLKPVDETRVNRIISQKKRLRELGKNG